MKMSKFIAIMIILLSMNRVGTCEADQVIITDISSWNHPVKSVLEKNKVILNKVELLNNKKLPVFFVEFPYDPNSSETKSYFNKLFIDVLNANGTWDYKFNDETWRVVISIHWDTKSKTIDIGYE